MIQEQWSGQEIAIVGMSFRFPGAADRKTFWANLSNGLETITTLSKAELQAAGVPGEQLNDPRFVSAIGRLGDVSLFDAAFFGYSPAEALELDPQKRLFLECAWEAIEDAGYDLARWKGVVGVFAGSKSSTYIENLSGRDESSAFALLGNDKDFLATAVSYKMNLTGPSINVQTACSTSLVATFLASQALLSYQCDMALAGAVSITLPQESGYIYLENGVMSPDGHCRAFDEKAQGAAPGNGVAVIVLKRLSDALADDDQIHAVIRGIAINNDGATKVGFTAPSVAGQAEVIATALAAAQVSPETISYVETHGTGTPLGDTVEVAALTKAFRASTRKKQFCPIGSVKTNIGHTDVVAGAAGLIKTVLALQHGALPPSLNFATPNPRITFDDSPFYLNSRLQEWRRGAVPRRAGVSAFGLGGTNAHAIVEQAPAAEVAPTRLPCHLLLLSAKSLASLNRATEALAAHLGSEPASSIADIAYTLQNGRREFEYRRAVLCHSQQDAASALRSKSAWSGKAGEQKKIVFMFPGVGDHYPNMTADLYATFPQFRAEVDRCCAFLQPLLGKNLLRVLYPQEATQQHDTPDHAKGVTIRKLLNRSRNSTANLDEIHTVEVSHCIVFIVEYALARLWMSLGVRPNAMIGYSLGEYVAACLAGVFSLEDALRIMVTRARLVEHQPAGQMLAAAISSSDARCLTNTGVHLAAINGSELCVFAGTAEEIENLETHLKGEFVACRRLPVNRALHSPLMKAAAADFAYFLNSVAKNRAAIPYISNVTGDWIKDEQCTDSQHWAAHTTQTVLFSEGIRELLKIGASTFLEVGPGESLGSFVLQQDAIRDSVLVLPSVPNDLNPSREVDFFMESIARLWLSGHKLEWPQFYAGEKRRRVPLPTYQFDHQRYWVEPQTKPKPSSAPLRKNPSVREWLYAPSWKRMPLPVRNNAREKSGIWLIFANDTPSCSALVRSLTDAGEQVRTVTTGEAFQSLGNGRFTVNPSDKSSYARLLTILRKEDLPIDRVLHFWTFGEEKRSDDQELSTGFFSLLYLVQVSGLSQEIKIDVISSSAQEVTGGEEILPERATVLSLCRTVPQEFPNVQMRHIDAPHRDSRVCASLIRETETFIPGISVAYRGAHRWVQDFERIDIDPGPSPIREGGIYLITGGLGRVGLALAEHLATHSRARLVLVARTPLPERARWREWIQAHGDEDSVSRKLLVLQRMEAAGTEFEIVSADVADEAAMAGVFKQTTERWGRIAGVIHAAGITDPASMKGIDELSLDQVRAHFRGKVVGAQVLVQILQHYEPDFCVLMSSLSVILGGLGMAAYAAANQYLSALALRQGRGSATAWLSIDWDTWDVWRDGGHIGSSQSTLSDLIMTPEEGIEAFMLLLRATSSRHLVVSIGDLGRRLKTWVKMETSDSETQSQRASVRHPRPSLASPYVPPSTEIEKDLAQIWSEVLGVDEIGIHDNFFQLGGHSLLGIRMISKLRNEFGVEIHVRQIFTTPTIAQMADAVLQQMADLAEAQGAVKEVLMSSEREHTSPTHG
jgi:acyl transferase domain-containing protein/acyl carrier protein